MTLRYDLYWSFRSPYSYLVTPRLVELERAYDVEANVRVVYPIAVRQPDFFAHSDKLWFSYFMVDVFRTAEFIGLPFAWPSPDPVAMDLQTGTYPKEQPRIHRLTRLGQAAVERGKGLPFLDEASRVIWGGTVRNWHEGDHLAGAARRAGLDLAEMDAAIAADPEHFDRAIHANEADQRKGGHYGVPLMVFDGKPFFGQDRFDQLEWRMQQKGLTKR